MDATIFYPPSRKPIVKAPDSASAPSFHTLFQNELDGAVNSTTHQNKFCDEEEEDNVNDSKNDGEESGDYVSGSEKKYSSSRNNDEGDNTSVCSDNRGIKPVTSKDSFKYAVHFQASPKAVTLMRTRKQASGEAEAGGYMYHEDMGVLDRHEFFMPPFLMDTTCTI